MPRGIPNKPREPDASLEAMGAAPAVETASPARSREALDAEKYTQDFLKRNRPNLAGFEQKLGFYGQHPGWVRRWVVDQAQRVPSLLEQGWRFVLLDEVGMSGSIGRGNTDLGDRVSITTTVGDGPVRQILMETTQQLYDMQCEAALEPVRRSEAAIRAGAFAVTDTKPVYQPKGIDNRVEQKSLQ